MFGNNTININLIKNNVNIENDAWGNFVYGQLQLQKF